MELKAGKDPLYKQAESLVAAAKVNAISAFLPLSNKHPILNKVNVEAWDFFATAATIFVAINNLKVAVDQQRFRIIYGVFLPSVRKWHDNGEDVVLDCQQFVARNVAGGVSPQDALGLWVLWNTFGREPTEAELSSAKAIGTVLSTPMHDWWRE
jgi:hypothetical protein